MALELYSIKNPQQKQLTITEQTNETKKLVS
jgi:hypothetical protein